MQIPKDVTISSALLGVGVTLGNLAIWLGLACSVTCVVLYWVAMIRAMRRPAEAPGANGNGKKAGRKASANGAGVSASDRRTDRVGLWARRFFYLTCGCVVVGAGSLMALVLNQQYIVHYIWKNSNKELPFGFRLASFWADQEGTFFLWGVYNVVIGGFILWRARLDERWIMPFFTLIHVSLFTLLMFMNPFWLPDPKEVRAGLEGVSAPPEFLTFLPSTLAQHLSYYFGWGQYINPKYMGTRGLNEQLQNFWMVIHPPTLFVGYSTMVVPSCFALGALMRRDYDGWVNRVAPWLAFSWCVLGFGIFLGAYWAYETLGWGGYWSWDPVENSSLIPWLVATTLVHGLLAQRNRGNFKQANLFLGVMLGASVLLGSFLVRSGILSENSVHSFAEPQFSVFVTLLVILAIWFVMSVVVWLWRFRDIQASIAYEHVWERHFGFFLGLIVLSAISVVVMFGVTLPIWKPWLPGALGGKGSVDYTFYNKALLPVAYVMIVLMTLTPLMPWKNTGSGRAMKPFTIVALILAALFTAFFLFAAVWAWMGGFVRQNDLAYIGFGLALALGLVTNAVVLRRAATGGILNASPWITHMGFMVMLAGIVITSRFNTTRSFAKVEKGQSVRAYGRDFTFQGSRPAANDQDRDRFLVDMKTADGKVRSLAPKLWNSKIAGQPMAWPEIVNEWFGGAWGDIYVEPSGIDHTGTISVTGVARGNPKPVGTVVQHRLGDPEDEVAFRFEELDTSEMQKALKANDGRPLIVHADVTMIVNGVSKRIRSAARVTMDEATPHANTVAPIPIEGLRQPTRYSLRFKISMVPGRLTADFELQPAEAVTQGYFQVLHVPGIQVLWLGAYIMYSGAFMVFLRRRKLARRPAPAVAQTGPDPEPIPSRTPAKTPAPEPVAAE